MAQASSDEVGHPGPMYWAAIWRDARQNAAQMDEIQQSLAWKSREERLVSSLPLLRLHDIVTWSAFTSKR